MTNVSETASRLTEAMHAGELISIIYHGGSKPGAKRELLPIMVGAEKFRARCYTSNAVKSFKISQVEILARPVSDADRDQMWSSQSAPYSGLTTVSQVRAHFDEELRRLNWHVEEISDGDDRHLMLFVRLKNGKTRKHPKVVLSYETTAYDLSMTPEGESILTNPRPRTRPWGVRGGTGSSGTWKDPAKAIAAFARAAGIVA